MHSPSFRELRSYSAKRRRSPDTSPSPLERHSKRVSLAVESEFIPSPTIPQNILRGSSSASTSRFSSEDWVKQADSLTIDSPLLPSVQSGLAQEVHHVNRQETMDDIMTTDSDENISMYRPQLLVPRSAHRPHAPHIQITTSSATQQSTQEQYNPYSRHQSSLLSAPQQYAYSLPPQTELSIPQGQGPMIRVLPATPSDSPITHQDQTARSQALLPTSQPSPMAMSSTNSPSPVANRKQRFTMGPRSDCEKCRLGVKGHWMHFD